MRIAILAAGAITAAAPAQAPKGGDYDFAYTFPPAAARIAPLRAWLDADRARLRAKVSRDAAAAKVEAKRAGFPYRRYETTRTWKVVTETPRLLSLSSDSYDYTGGAHGSPATGSLVWDKVAGRRLAPLALFTTPAAVQAALWPAYCARLDAERAKRRGAPVERGGDNSFNRCPRLSETVLLLGSTDRRRIDRIGIIADPYVAGAYAEGRYEVTLPVTRALLAAVRPAYRDAFGGR